MSDGSAPSRFPAWRRPLTALGLALALGWSAPAADAPFSPDLRHTFFSRKGTWMALHPTEKPGVLRAYFSRMNDSRGNWLDLAFLPGGSARPLALRAEADAITLSAGGAEAARAVAYIAGPLDTVVDARDMDLDLASVKKGLDLAALKAAGPRTWETACEGWTLRVELLEGRAEAPTATGWRLKPEAGRLRVALRLYRGQAPAPIRVDPERDRAAIRADWQAWRARMPKVAPERQGEAEAAWWDLWSLHTPVDTIFPTEAVLVSKVDMNAVWPWDHCFATLGLGLTDLPAALDQFWVPFANQKADGQLPDQMLPEDVFWGCTKPPIHGWTLDRLMERHRLSRAQVEKLYPALVRWTEFWFTVRDTDRNGIPAFGGGHSGWDSGWDNATVLPDPKADYETPELQAYLVLQMHTLGRLAEQLGKEGEARTWHARAEAHQQRLRKEFWNGHTFTVRQVGGPAPDPDPTSLLPLMPLVLGERLDRDIFDTLAKRLEARFLTPVGPATEDPRSPHYRPDGYWRGPVWAPSTLLLADGLRRGGRPDLAREIARRFCDTVARAGGRYENYDSLTGQGLRGKGFAWTAGVQLVFLADYLATPAPGPR